jgi:2-haloacid dehalogenase
MNVHAQAPAAEAVIFDLGGVLIDWNPRHLYRKLIADEDRREWFLSEICSPDWNLQQDYGRPIADANAELCARFPEHRELIHAFYGRWPEMLNGAIEPTVRVLERLDARGVPLYALTNWSAETYGIAEPMFPFLQRFRHVAVSGRLKMGKPDARIYQHVLQFGGLDPRRTVFIDDSAKNVDAATALGLHGIRFTDADDLARRLTALGLL